MDAKAVEEWRCDLLTPGAISPNHIWHLVGDSHLACPEGRGTPALWNRLRISSHNPLILWVLAS